MLLLFTVGLEFSLLEIQRIWRAVVFGGSLQIGGTAAVLMLLLFVTGQDSWRTSLFIGLFVALSSTAIVLRELSSRNQLDAPHGRLMVGVLLFQDLAIVGLLLLVPILSGRTALNGRSDGAAASGGGHRRCGGREPAGAARVVQAGRAERTTGSVSARGVAGRVSARHGSAR